MQLFSHILVGFNNANDIDLDKLTKLLEENHDLLQDIVINEDSGSSSTLPKVLLDLVNQINDKEEKSSDKAEKEEIEKAGNTAIKKHKFLYKSIIIFRNPGYIPTS